MTDTIYLYRPGHFHETCLCQAIAGDDGRVLFHCESSSEWFAKKDMSHPKALQAYEEHFPDGYEIEDLFGLPWTEIPMLVEFEQQGIGE